ncbi:unnamed protein product [Dovyalis caffra]|uniref:AtuA-like ferredoxin-fold domain-containing protein n=1 Tax=Dovyalis caffra TaxID=77055 RepID=A0AAV1S9W1_9ROSI|nr:unnamed protein product [Dovyalis caffra]
MQLETRIEEWRPQNTVTSLKPKTEHERDGVPLANKNKETEESKVRELEFTDTEFKADLNLRNVGREHVFWRTGVKCTKGTCSNEEEVDVGSSVKTTVWHDQLSSSHPKSSSPGIKTSPAPSGQKIPLYSVAHTRVGDKGNDLNFSIIPHYPSAIESVKLIITPQWVKEVVSTLLNTSSFPDSFVTMKRDKWVSEHVNVEIYEAKGINSLNIVVRNILDGGVNCSRRIDRHGKTISDLVLCQQVVLPP